MLSEESRSEFREVLDNAMRKEPVSWREHYHGNEKAMKLMRSYSFFDRSRCYLPDRAVMDAQNKLFDHISRLSIPNGLISQFFPTQANAFRSEQSAVSTERLVLARICDCLEDYLYAVVR